MTVGSHSGSKLRCETWSPWKAVWYLYGAEAVVSSVGRWARLVCGWLASCGEHVWTSASNVLTYRAPLVKNDISDYITLRYAKKLRSGNNWRLRATTVLSCLGMTPTGAPSVVNSTLTWTLLQKMKKTRQ